MKSERRVIWEVLEGRKRSRKFCNYIIVSKILFLKKKENNYSGQIRVQPFDCCLRSFPPQALSKAFSPIPTKTSSMLLMRANQTRSSSFTPCPTRSRFHCSYFQPNLLKVFLVPSASKCSSTVFLSAFSFK